MDVIGGYEDYTAGKGHGVPVLVSYRDTVMIVMVLGRVP